jgi:hypothetical protein
LRPDIVGFRVGDLPKPAPYEPDEPAGTLHEQTGERVDKLAGEVASCRTETAANSQEVARLEQRVEKLAESLNYTLRFAVPVPYDKSAVDRAREALREAQHPTED